MIVLTPRLMQLRRLVIGEVSRFSDLARVLYERGPARAMKALATTFAALSARGLLKVRDPAMAAMHFNWLVMSQALNQAMLLGDEAIPKRAELRRLGGGRCAGISCGLRAVGAAVARWDLILFTPPCCSSLGPRAEGADRAAHLTPPAKPASTSGLARRR
jgi:hypothetical protein